MGILDLLGFGKKRKMMIKEALSKGAIIVDVRTTGEFSLGHIEGSINIPLSELSLKVKKLKKMNKTILLCCASGIRSASASAILKGHGIESKNAGSWQSLRQ